MAKTKVSLANTALQDLKEIKAWYAAESVPEIGERLVAEIIAKIEPLADHPDMGRIVPEFEQPYIRELIHPPFRIVYRRSTGRARIVRVWRSERQLTIP